MSREYGFEDALDAWLLAGDMRWSQLSLFLVSTITLGLALVLQILANISELYSSGDLKGVSKDVFCAYFQRA